jgi:hypothetical protein
MDDKLHDTSPIGLSRGSQRPVDGSKREKSQKEEDDITPDNTPSTPTENNNENDSPQFQSIAPGNMAQLYRLASIDSLSRPISHSSTDKPDSRAQDPALDPSNPRFNIYKWTKMILTSMDDDHIPIQRSGFCFKDLNVYGSGASMNIQKDVLSVFMAPLRLHEWVDFGDRNRRCILHGFNGVVKAGEMLIVLGRPGSGCSTFLKSITGELHGLELGSKDSLSYDGPSKMLSNT